MFGVRSGAALVTSAAGVGETGRKIRSRVNFSIVLLRRLCPVDTDGSPLRGARQLAAESGDGSAFWVFGFRGSLAGIGDGLTEKTGMLKGCY